MINIPAAGIDSSMDAVGEGEAQEVVGGGDEIVDDLDDDIDQDDNDVDEEFVLLDDEEFERQLQENMLNGDLPDEVSEYLQSLEAQTRQLEEELEDCDDLIGHSGPPLKANAVVVYDEAQEMEREAAAQGMTVEEFRLKLLQEAEADDFNEDDMDKEFEELAMLQDELAQIRADAANVIASRPLDSYVPMEPVKSPTAVLALEGPISEEKSSEEDRNKKGELCSDNIEENEAAGEMVDVKAMDGVLVSTDMLTDMRAFIQEQLRSTDEWYTVRKQRLKQSLDSYKQAQDRWTEREEEKKKEFMTKLEEEERALLSRKEEWERRIEREIQEKNEEVVMELQSQQAEISRVTQALDEERRQFEAFRREVEEQQATRKAKAATDIQRTYRGFKTRKAMAPRIAELDELRELRKKERHDVRVMELEYEIKYREEQAQKEKEEQQRKEEEEKRRKEGEEKERELERQRKEEEERIKEEQKKEDERKKEEERKEEERKKRELEEEKKEEERRRKEEEKKKKEEEKRLKEEEKKRKEEEKKRQKEEEKKQKEEEKRQKEEEKKRKAEEEKQRKEAEKREKEQAEKKKSEVCVISPPELSKSAENVGAESGIEAGSTIIFDPQNSAADITVESRNSDQNEETMQPCIPNGETTIKSSQAVEEKVTSDQKKEFVGDALQHSATSAVPGMKFTPRPPSQPPPPTQQQSSRTPPPIQTAVAATSDFSRSKDPKNLESSLVSSTVEATQRTGSSTMDSESAFQNIVPTSHMMTPPPPKPDPVEVLRLKWMGSCLSWSKVSNEPWKLKPTSQKPHKRPGSAKKLPPLDKDVILSAAHAESLREVSSVKLTELPGCSLSTLSQCWSLRYLTVTHSGLTSLDGISQCRHLHYVNAEHNHIEYVDLKDLGSLQVLLLSHNKLSVIHGLDGCINLRWLDLSNNRINKLGGGSGTLRRLHSLNLSHNQLVSAEGISDLVTLQQLNLSHNYLQALPGLNKLCLLMELDLAANNMQEVPLLKNQVLLRKLNLQENSLSAIQPLSSCWLPLLTSLDCGQNMLECLDGLQCLILLAHLDVANNLITELDALTSDLPLTLRLTHLVLEGNPVVDVHQEDYRDRIQQTCHSLIEIDNLPMPPLSPKVEQATNNNQEFMAMCQSQVKVQDQLWEDFRKQLMLLQSKSHVNSETMCSTIFKFCDTSFKMAAEHRASHEYGDLSTASSISQFISPLGTSSTPRGSQASSSLDKKAKFEAVLASQASGSNFHSPRSSIKDSHDSFAQSFRRNSNSKTDGHSLPQYKADPGVVNNSEKFYAAQNKSQHQKTKMVADSMDSSDSSDDGVDVTDFSENNLKMNVKVTASAPVPPPAASYMNEKDKFEMALQGGGDGMSSRSEDVEDELTPQYRGRTPSEGHLIQQLSSQRASKASGQGFGSQAGHQKNLFEQALQAENHSGASAKDKFNAALMGDVTGLKANTGMPSQGSAAVTADIVGHHLAGHRDQPDDLDLAAYELDDFDLDGLDMDIDKFLDMGELDDFLEKGWRPEDMPQIPQSSYPVLGKINSSNYGSNHNNSNSNSNNIYQPHSLTTPPPPPTQAWRDGPVAELKGKPPRPGPSPLPLPSPSPSSVASAAETLGGSSSLRNKRDELSQEWGFKDERTAEMMMARAKKMKYNAERKRKLNKLNPQQRYQLFRKLEESGKIRHVRPPPAKILPRKEYFQAREEEAQRQEFERQAENHTRANRTFEWLHTQVGDYNVSSSRINPGPALYANTGKDLSRRDAYHNDDYNVRRISPNSDHMDSVSTAGPKKFNQNRRFSIGESHTSHTPTLPPIQVSSAPSTHKGERISWRDEPVEQSVGWGGGKKRNSVARK